MRAPVIYLDRAAIRPGRLDDLRRAFGELAAFVEAHEPALISYAVYFSEDGTRSSVMHVHRDEASLIRHKDVIQPLLPPFADLLRLTQIEVFGEIGLELRAQLEAKLRLLGDEALLFNRPHAGFLRAGEG